MKRMRFYQKPRICGVVLGLVAGLICFPPIAFAADPSTSGAARFDEGQKIEVREGDMWSSASIVKHEGRKYLIHYDGADAATDEWVTSDRIRLPGSTPAKGPSAAATQAGASHLVPNSAVPKPATVFVTGKQVEVKWGGMWRKAVIVNRRGEWYLIDYDGNKFFREWVEPWRVRAVGSTEDPIGYATINPGVHHNEGPPREKPGEAPPAGGKGNAPEDVAAQSDLPVTAVDRSNSNNMDAQGLAPLAQLAPDAAVRPAGPLLSQPMTLKGATAEFFDRPAALLFSSPATAMAAVLLRNAPPGQKQPSLRVERIDLTTGRSLNVAALETADSEALDFSPDGKLFASHTTVFGPGKGGRLDIWQVDADAKANQVISFIPNDDAHGGEAFITWARFVDTDHLLALNRGGTLSYWNFRKASQIWTFKAGLQASAAMSPNKKYVALMMQAGVVVLESATGKSQGRIDVDNPRPISISFKPDGTRLAAAGPDLLRIWDTATGQKTDEIWTVGASGNSIDWISDGYVLLDGASIVLLAKHAIVWTYSGAGSGRAEAPTSGEFAGRFYYLVDRDAGRQERGAALASVVLPDQEVKNLLVAIGDPRMLIKPGSSISLEVSVDGSIQQEVTDSLTAKLKANGITVADNQAIKLIAKSEPGETKEMSYRRIGRGAFGQVDKVSVQETKNSIVISGEDGKALWQRHGVMLPSLFLQLKQGQTIEDAIAEQMKPKPGFFTSATLPKYIPKSPTGFGKSHLSDKGAAIDRPTPSGT